MSEALVADIAASEPHDIAQVILQLRDALVLLLDDSNDLDVRPAWRKARRLVDDLDAGELLWPGWKEKAAQFAACNQAAGRPKVIDG